MRCASADYSINATAELRVKGSQVSGSWEEKTYSAVGQVTGRYTGNAFVLSIQGANFTAAINVTLANCKQTINITPQGLEVNRISIGLAKCWEGMPYVIFDVEIKDAARYQEFMSGVKPALEAAGARYLARGGAHKVYEGDWEPRRIVLLEFPSVAASGVILQTAPPIKA